MTKKSVILDYSEYVVGDFGQYLNSSPPRRSFEERMINRGTAVVYKTAQKHRLVSGCPYCSTALTQIVRVQPDTPSGSSNRPEHTLKQCSKCGWWFYDFCLWGYINDCWDWFYYEGVLKTFDFSSLEVPVSVLKSHLSKRFEDIRSIHPKKFEELCADIFSDYMDCEVRLTAYSKDGGIDLYAIDGDTKLAIQLKRRARAVVESVESVRAFLGAMIVDGTPNGLFCTTADHFSRDALAATGSAALLDYGITLDLVDFHELAQIFDICAHDYALPWEFLLKKHYCNQSVIEQAVSLGRTSAAGEP